MDAATANRFWSKVAKRGPDDCWLWIGRTNSRGYGGFDINQKALIASRVAWALSHGEEVPTGLLVCHRCDNPPCCNPAHLWLGTHFDNMHDAIAKGRLRLKQWSGVVDPKFGHGRECRKCGHLRTDDYFERSGFSWPIWKCRNCNRTRGAASYVVRRARMLAEAVQS